MGFPYEFTPDEDSPESLHAARRIRHRHPADRTTAGQSVSLAIALRQARIARRYKFDQKPAAAPSTSARPGVIAADR